MTGDFGFSRVLRGKQNIMADTNDFVTERATASRSAQEIIAATFAWDEMTDTAWESAINEMLEQKETVADKNVIKVGDADALDMQLDLLHDRTVSSLGLFRVKYRDNPAMIHTLKPLSAKGGSRGNIQDEALDFESAWEKWAPTWLPRPTQTLASFKTLRELCLALREPYSKSKQVWREATGSYNDMGESLNKLCKAWYEAATIVFPEGSPQGDMIRGTVPTTYTPPAPVPGKAVITSLTSPADGEALIGMEAANASSFNVLLKAPGATVFSNLAEEVEGPEYLAAGFEVGGTYHFIVVGVNGSGAGEQSDAQSVLIAKP